ncbi:hypothetical protein JK359_38155 [Streptomyces actinomycinicus]|uniref:Peptidase M11 gametolysin domain-containing protein n=1 Tax=Streptomyces actinomycinicus TaxID=1695166 RepID=A0A937JUB3_9ACTN|nr:hypothetical protein [Streptomyces actinomycinicus]MBL1087688.1 hypothetical protein [Streptomyces actinomycinicus]
MSSARIRVAIVTGGVLLAAGLATGASSHAEEGGTNRMLPVLINFSDSAHADPGTLKAAAAERYFGAIDSLASYYTQVSGGAMTYTPAVHEKVVGPYTLDLKAAGCDWNGMRQLTQEELEERGLTQGDDYDSLSIILPGEKSDCNWGGMGDMPGPYTWVNQRDADMEDPTVLIHEVGHNLGLDHQPRPVRTAT